MINNFDKKQSLDDLIKFLSIEGVTGEERDIAMSIKNDLISSGIPSEYITFDNANEKIPLPTQVGNLIIKLPGTVKAERIMFSSHLDTVPLCRGAIPVINGDKILSYFEEVEKLNIPKEKEDILLLKKALYLLKNSKKGESKKILNKLIENNSSLKTLAEEILKD